MAQQMLGDIVGQVEARSFAWPHAPTLSSSLSGWT
jgi:hypothetical protein